MTDIKLLRERGVIRNSTWYDRQCNGQEKKVYSETVHGMTDSAMAKRKKCNQKQYMVRQTM